MIAHNVHQTHFSVEVIKNDGITQSPKLHKRAILQCIPKKGILRSRAVFLDIKDNCKSKNYLWD
jgi:hypothetical protein